MGLRDYSRHDNLYYDRFQFLLNLWPINVKRLSRVIRSWHLLNCRLCKRAHTHSLKKKIEEWSSAPSTWNKCGNWQSDAQRWTSRGNSLKRKNQKLPPSANTGPMQSGLWKACNQPEGTDGKTMPTSARRKHIRSTVQLFLAETTPPHASLALSRQLRNGEMCGMKTAMPQKLKTSLISVATFLFD